MLSLLHGNVVLKSSGCDTECSNWYTPGQDFAIQTVLKGQAWLECQIKVARVRCSSCSEEFVVILYGPRYAWPVLPHLGSIFPVRHSRTFLCDTW